MSEQNIIVNGVDMKTLRDNVEKGYNPSSATILDMIGQLSAARAEVDEIRRDVKEWLCEKCNTVYPGPPQTGFKCVVCPACGGTTAPRTTIERRKAEEERDQLREQLAGAGGGWIPIAESTIPKRHQPVALLDVNRFQNCHFELNIHDVGYLEGEAPILYWAIRGERAQDIFAFTHYLPLPTPPQGDGHG